MESTYPIISLYELDMYDQVVIIVGGWLVPQVKYSTFRSIIASQFLADKQ